MTITRTELIEKAAATLDEARAANDPDSRDTLSRVASGYTALATLLDG